MSNTTAQGVCPGFNFSDLEMMNEIIAFVAGYWNEPKNRLQAETSLNHDLGMDGTEAAPTRGGGSARQLG